MANLVFFCSKKWRKKSFKITISSSFSKKEIAQFTKNRHQKKQTPSVGDRLLAVGFMVPSWQYNYGDSLRTTN